MWPFSELKRLRAAHASLVKQRKEAADMIVQLRHENKSLHARLLDAHQRLRNPPIVPPGKPNKDQITKERVVQLHLLREMQNNPPQRILGELREINGDAVKFADSMAGLPTSLEPGED